MEPCPFPSHDNLGLVALGYTRKLHLSRIRAETGQGHKDLIESLEMPVANISPGLPTPKDLGLLVCICGEGSQHILPLECLLSICLCHCV